MWVNHSVKQRMRAGSWGGGRNCHGEPGEALVASVCVCVCARCVCVKQPLWRKGWECWLCARRRRERGGSAGCAWACVDHGRRPWLCECVCMGEGLEEKGWEHSFCMCSPT